MRDVQHHGLLASRKGDGWTPPSRLHEEFIRKHMRYDESIGDLFWMDRTGSDAQFNGKKVGRKTSGYQVATVYGRAFPCHRIIWFLHHGRWPTALLDHINHDTLDNRIANLREATRRQNAWNLQMKPSNRSGYKGVSLHKQSGKYVAAIRMPEGKTKHLGTFKDPQEAHHAYLCAAKELHGEFVNTEFSVQRAVLKQLGAKNV